MEYKKVKFQVKSLSEEGQFEGYAAVKGNIDSYGDIIQDGAFKRTLNNQKQFPILFMHDPMRPCGLSVSMKEDRHGLFIKGQLDLSTDLGRMVHSGMKMGYIDCMSIGYRSMKDSMNKKGNRLLKEIKLLECSMITKGFAANELALVSGFKSKHIDTLIDRIENLEKRLIEMEENNIFKKEDLSNMEDMAEDYGEEEAIDEEDREDEDESEAEMIEEAMQLLDDLHAKLGIIKDRVEKRNKACDTMKELDIVEEESMGDSPKMALAHMTDSLSDTLSFAVKSVGGDANLPLASKEHPWDGPKAEKRIFEWAGGKDFDPKKAKKAFFYFDSANPKERGSYKLPFADVVNSKLVAVPRAISAVKGALAGARGGVDIPRSDKASILRKVEAYENRINKDDPDKADLTALLRDMKNFARSVK